MSWMISVCFLAPDTPCHHYDGVMLFSEIHKYGDFYRFSDVRPPFTYAALIRQVRWRVHIKHNNYYYIVFFINWTRRMAIANGTCVSLCTFWPPLGTPWDNRGKCYMAGKRIQCWSNASQHIPIYLLPFTSYSEILVGNCSFPTPLHLTPPLGVFPLEFREKVWSS